MQNILVAIWLLGAVDASSVQTLPGTAPLEATGDLAQAMVAGIDQWLDRALAASIDARKALWRR
ncbi:MAG TPA: hypothetical protein PKW60_12820, partial [Candidatus Hydrogenedentes bacterium]|nr:hypothetical protein [Candidatus Hydrogenedentota bacterium]